MGDIKKLRLIMSPILGFKIYNEFVSIIMTALWA